tara:strand:+ start:4313 stop:5623 length:1311 start_codon:yes stop_codon:yes gene_type:complete
MNNTGQKLYLKAKKVILGGNMLLSKRPEMTLPNLWPAYYSKSNKIFVWDLDNKKYIDMICFVGQNILGYANKSVDKFVFKNAAKGNMTSLNCPEEVILANKLIELHPWAKVAKFARSGGEANAMSIRIARASTKRDHIAICGYHGWHDWYLSVNLSGKNKLNNHHLPGLLPDGVPKNLKNTVHPFNYGDFEKLKKISKKYKLAAIKMEVARNALPDIDFLKKIRKFATKNKIVLIFDECTSGFRRNLGGLHMTQKIYPDMCMFGKALGNGYAITAVIGKKNIMNKAKNSFISSTFWSERIGFLAGIRTIDVMKKIKSWEKIIKSGKYLSEKIKELAKKYKLSINVGGIDSITYYSFNSKKNLKYKTFISQEMLKKGYLASNITFLTIFHTKNVIDEFIKNLDPIFLKISKFENNKINVDNFLKGPVCHATFKRLTD